MSEAVIAQKEPYAIEVNEGEIYFWCACGRSANQPFCDGSHKDTGFTPVRWQADKAGRKFFCGCKRTDATPFCDGTHNGL